MQRWKIALPVASIGIASVGLWSAIAPAPARPTIGQVAAAAPVDPAIASTTLATTTAPTTTTVAPTTTTAVVAATTGATFAVPATTVVAGPEVLSVPAQVPTDPRADVDVVQIGRITIPKIGLDHAVYEGIWLTVIDVGPGHWPGTPMPGGYGNAVFGGHRVTKTHPFMDLDLLTAGDAIYFTLNDGSIATYRMTEQLIVQPEDIWITDQSAGRTLTLFACHPKGSARQRIVIRAEFVPA